MRSMIPSLEVPISKSFKLWITLYIWWYPDRRLGGSRSKVKGQRSRGQRSRGQRSRVKGRRDWGNVLKFCLKFWIFIALNISKVFKIMNNIYIWWYPDRRQEVVGQRSYVKGQRSRVKGQRSQGQRFEVFFEILNLLPSAQRMHIY